MVSAALRVVPLGLAVLLVSGCETRRTDAPGGAVEVTAADVPRQAGAPIAEIPERDVRKVADTDMRAVLGELDALGPKPLATSSPEEARRQPTPADAMQRLLAKDKKSVAAMEKVEERTYPGAGGDLAVRMYTPKTKKDRPLPVVTYFHGGGFVVGSIDAYDGTARALADETKAIVVAPELRRAPEDKFPAAHDDAFAAYQWVLASAPSFGGDPKRVAVAGEGAGGSLAVHVSVRARAAHLPLPAHQLLVYPVATTGMATDSYKEWAHAKPLDAETMRWFLTQTMRTPADADDPRLDLVHANLAGLPPTTIVLAEIDPLRSDGELLAKKLASQGVDVETKTYEGVTHEFFGMSAEVSDARAAVSYAGRRLERSLLPGRRP